MVRFVVDVGTVACRARVVARAPLSGAIAAEHFAKQHVHDGDEREADHEDKGNQTDDSYDAHYVVLRLKRGLPPRFQDRQRRRIGILERRQLCARNLVGM
jgi:hypothetical protein